MHLRACVSLAFGCMCASAQSLQGIHRAAYNESTDTNNRVCSDVCVTQNDGIALNAQIMNVVKVCMTTSNP